MIISLLDVILFGTYFILLFLATFWLIVLFSSENEPKKGKLDRTPFFTAIVPAFNEEKSIASTIKSLINLDYPNDKIEIIVVNDGSSDGTKEIVEKIISANPNKSITLINQKNQGKGKALNVGLEIAKGEFYACLDADSFIDSNALQVI